MGGLQRLIQIPQVKIGKGLKGRYWQASFENLGGADFSLDTIDVDWEVQSRRVA